MTDQVVEWQFAGRPDPAKPRAQRTDVGLSIAAIIATTRREWMSQGGTPPARGEAPAERTRFAHPLIRFALDAKRSDAWRARRSGGAEAMPGTDCRPGARGAGCVLELDSD